MSEVNNADGKVVAPVAAPAADPVVASAPKAEGQVVSAPKVEAKPVEPPKFSMPKGLATELHTLREERKQLREALKKAEEAAKYSHPTPAPTPAEDPSFIEEPEKRLAIERERIKADILSTVRNESAAAIQAQRLQEQGAKAIDYILTQPEVNGDVEKYREIDELIATDPELSEVVKVAPLLAGKTALERWKQGKGIDEARRTAAAGAAAASVTAKSGPANPVSKRNVADIKSDLKQLNPNSPDFNHKWESLAKELQTAGG